MVDGFYSMSQYYKNLNIEPYTKLYKLKEEAKDLDLPAGEFKYDLVQPEHLAFWQGGTKLDSNQAKWWFQTTEKIAQNPTNYFEPNTIDMHEFRIEHTHTLMYRLFYDEMFMFQDYVCLITGRGNHSVDNICKTRKFVIDYLELLEIQWYHPYGNDGRVAFSKREWDMRKTRTESEILQIEGAKLFEHYRSPYPVHPSIAMKRAVKNVIKQLIESDSDVISIIELSWIIGCVKI